MAICRRALVTFALSFASPSLLTCAYRIQPSTRDGQVLPSNQIVKEQPLQLHAPTPEPSANILRQGSHKRRHGRRYSLRRSKLAMLHTTILGMLQNAFAEKDQSPPTSSPPGDPSSIEDEPIPPKLPAERIVRDPEQVYLAICLVVRDQNQDLREWIEYHRRVGVGKFYIFDDNSLLSSEPAAEGLQDLIQEGLVECEAVGPVPDSTTRPQMFVYDKCIQSYRAKHQWMAFIDVDEFLVIRDASVESLPQLLSEYTDYGALAVNWQLFGASGHAVTPQGSTLTSYTACYPEHDPENRHVKALVNMDFVYQTAGDPHHFRYYEGKYAVNSAGEKVPGPIASRVVTDRIVINHYVTKSLEEYQRKMARGSGMRNRKDMTFFQLVQLMTTNQCTYAVHLGEQQQTHSA